METERPLTIACHMKKTLTKRPAASEPPHIITLFSFNYFVESACVVSAGAIVAVESAGAIVLVVSGATVVVVSSVVVLELLLHAAKVPIAKTINNFFICLRFFL